MSHWIETLEALEGLYGTPAKPSLVKVLDRMSPSYLAHIEASRFCVLTTVGPEGTDASPRGDEGPVVQALDPQTLLLPDWKGNERIDSLRNVVRDGRVSLMFLTTGSNIAMRVNGRAKITVAPEILARFTREGKTPRSVLVIQIAEVYPQCARAILRSDLWGAAGKTLPSMGEMLREATLGDFDAESYDRDWPQRAAATKW